MIRRINGEDGVARYDRSYVPHGHLFCIGCKRIYDFDIPNFEKTLAGCSEAVIDSYELTAKGLCNSCKSDLETAQKVNNNRKTN